jgi:hypothetical protein
MDRSDSQRLRNDLKTLRTLLGADLPFERMDARGMLSMGVAALLPAITCLSGGRSPWLLLGSAGPVLAILGVLVIRNYRGSHPSKACPAAKRREYRVGLPILILSLPLIFGFIRWAISAGTSATVASGCVLLFIGMLLLYQGLYDVGRRSNLFVAVPVIVIGLLWPFISYFERWTSLWLALGLSTIAAAIYMHWQLESFNAREKPVASGEAVDGAD